MSNNNKSNITQKLNNGTQACAACKHQRRKCASDCILAPYFPQNRQLQFVNAHKLFGVSNITKIIRNLDPPLKDEAMRTIIIESDVRASDPVGGCYKIIHDLQRQVDYYTAELELVYYQLALCRFQETQHNYVGVTNHDTQPELEEQNNESHQPHQNQFCLEDFDHNSSNCEAITNSCNEGNNYQENCSDNVTQTNQVLLEGIHNCWSLQELDDDFRPFLDLPLDRVEFKFDLDQRTDSEFGLEDEDRQESKI